MYRLLNILLFILPFPFILINYILFEDVYESLYLVKHFVILIITLFCVLLESPFKKYRKNKRILILLLFLFLLYCLMNLLLLSNFNFQYFSFISSIIILLFFSFSFSKIPEGLRFLKTTYYSMLLILFVTISISFIYDLPVNSKWQVLDGSFKVRWNFGYLHPGYLSSYCLLTGLLANFFINKKILSKKHNSIIIISLIIIALTNTRNSMLSLVLYLLISNLTVNYTYLKVACFFVIAFVANFINFELLNIFSSGRLELWLAHFIYNYDSFSLLWGTGFGNANHLDFNKSFDENTIFHIDNYYFEILLQAGFVGFFLLLFILFAIYKLIKKNKNVSIKRVSFAIFFTLLFYGFFDSGFLTTGNIVPIILWPLLFSQLRINTVERTLKSKNYIKNF